MAYTITYNFGNDIAVGAKVAGGHSIRLSIEFTVEKDGEDIERYANDYGIRIKDWGELRWGRDLDENYMVPGNYEFELYDRDETLKTLLFEGGLVPYVNKDGKITMNIKYNGAEDYITEYIGYLDNENIEYDSKKKTVSFTAFPRTDLLKSIYLYDEGDAGVLIGNNPLGLDYGLSGDVYTATRKNIKELIHAIFKKINPDCTLSWQHNWKFWGQNIIATPTFYEEFLLDDLEFKEDYLSALFFSLENPYSIETLYDLLMRYSFTFGFICGMITNEHAFVKELFNYNPDNVQLLGRVREHIITHKAGDVESVRITQRLYRRVGSTKKNAYEAWSKSYAVLPPGAQLRGDSIIDDEIPVFAKYTLIGSQGDMLGTYNGFIYTIANANPPKLANFWSLDETIALFYYNLRNRRKLAYFAGNVEENELDTSIGRVDDFVVEGINYSYLKDFSYSGHGYQILSLTKRLSKNISEISAVLVTDAMEEEYPDTGIPPISPFMSVLPGGYLKEYSFNAKCIATDIDGGNVTLKNIEPGFRLTKVNFYFVKGFNNITNFILEDNDGPISTGLIIWSEDDNLVEIPVYKDYKTQNTLIITRTKSGTVTTGEVDIELKIQTRA